MRAELKHLQEELKATVIYVTHDQLEAMTMSDRVAIMNQGVLQQYGSPNDVFHKPANTFVASFMGSPPMNLLPAEVVQENGACGLSGDGFSFRPTSPRVQSILRNAPHKNLILGVRHTGIPLQLHEGEGNITASVYAVEPTGDISFVHVKVGEQLVISSTPNVGFHARAGDTVALKVVEDQMHIFDSASTASLMQ
jgi:multiple sugar transport system ATP-binding protein